MADRTIRVRLEAITTQFNAAMAKAGLTTREFRGNMQHADLSAKGMIGTLGGLTTGTVAVGVGAAVAAAGIVKMATDGVRAYVNLASEVRAYRRVAGGSAEESSRMVAALHAVGLDAQTGATALFRLAQNVDRHRDALKGAGIEVARNAAGNVDMNETLLNLSDAYRRIEDPQKRSVLLMNALGRGAVTLGPLLAAGRERIQEFWDAAARHHEILSDDDLRKARDLKYATHELSEAWGSFERQLGQDAVPLVTTGVHFLTRELDGTQKIANFLGRGLGDLTGIHLHHASAAKADAEAVDALKQSMEEAADSAKEYSASIDAMLKATFGVASTQDKFTGDLINFTDTVRAAQIAGDQYANSLDATTATGLANREMLRGLVTDIAASGKAARDAAAAQGESAEEQDRAVSDATASQRVQLGKVLEQLGFNNEAARQYTNVLLGLDNLNVSSTVDLEDAVARQRLDDFIKRTADIPRFIASTIVLDARFVKENEGVPSSIASPALLDARDAISKYLAGQNPSTPGLDQALAGQGPSATEAAQKAAQDRKTTEADLNSYLKAIYDERKRQEEELIRFYEGVWKHQQELEDNRFEAGDMGTDEYLRILRERLAGLEMYSNAWMDVWRKIQQLQADTLDSQLKIIEAYEQGRQFQLGFDALSQQRQSYGTLTPVSGATSSTTYTYGASYSPTFQISTSNPYAAATTANEQLRNYAAMVG